MINLIPPAVRREIGAARANTLLIRYNVVFLSAFGFVLLAIGVTYFYLVTAQASAETTMKENDAKAVQFADVQAKADQFRQNLLTAKQILDKEAVYSKVITDIAHTLPDGVILTNLSLDAATFGTETTLTANATSYEKALELKDTFGKSPLFSNVHFQSLDSSSSNKDYPFNVSLSVTFKKEAAKP